MLNQKTTLCNRLPCCLLMLLAACEPTTLRPQAPTALACFQHPSSQSPVLARVGSEALTWEHIVARIEEQGSMGRSIYADPKRLRKLVEDQVRLLLLTHAALERGLQQDPDVIEAARKVMVRKLLERDMSTEAFENQANDARLLEYYERRKDEYQQPEARRIMHIQLAPTPQGQAQAEQLLAYLQANAHQRGKFKAKARQHTLHQESRDTGGELPFLTHEQLIARFGLSFANEAFRLDPSAFAASPVQSTQGWHVLMLLARREARQLEFESVKEDIRDRLMRERRSAAFEAYLDNVRQRHPVVIYDHRFEALQKHIHERFGM